MAELIAPAATGGSSPLTRGKPHPDSHATVKRRLIPAHAGKTRSADVAERTEPAHPRSRGENIRSILGEFADDGSSPLTRGKHLPAYWVPAHAGLIPAHAGKTPRTSWQSSARGAHPRSRGENRPPPKPSSGPLGSSPLTRGKPPRERPRHPGRRLIPAHAGKTLPDLRFYCADRSDLGNP